LSISAATGEALFYVWQGRDEIAKTVELSAPFPHFSNPF